MVTILCCVDTPFLMYVCDDTAMDRGSTCTRLPAMDYSFFLTGWFVFCVVLHVCMRFRHRINIIGLLRKNSQELNTLM